VQRAVVGQLLAAGADPNARDGNGTTSLHRAIRNRCAVAVAALLAGGADPKRKNGRGSTCLQLASKMSGRGGTGAPAAHDAQREILQILRGASK
jgi:ankyrin repeat protein